MTAVHPQARQGPVIAWITQMIGTVVLAGVVVVFMRAIASPLSAAEGDWKRYAMAGVLLAGAPALIYLRTFKHRLDEDERAVKRLGAPDPVIRRALMKSLAIGGAMCELPQAFGVVNLFLGGEMRWFLGATLVTLALRLSYRPFTRMS